MKLRTNRVRSGFTLIELLVVIAIIAILAAILFPVFAQAREKARQSSCQSNMKQIALGIIQYQQDYDETYPMRFYNAKKAATYVPPANKAANECQAGECEYWSQAIQPQVKNVDVFKCPSNTGNQYGYGGNGTWDLTAKKNGSFEYDNNFTNTLVPSADYAINPRITDTFSTAGVLQGGIPAPKANASVNAPASTILLTEAKVYSTATNGVPACNPEAAVGFPTDVSTSKYLANTMFASHSGTGVYAFADGHVKSLKPTSTVGGNISQWGYWADASTNCTPDTNCQYVGGKIGGELQLANDANK